MTLESRVNKLDEYVLAMTTSVTNLSKEMSEFKDEMSEFKDEMKKFKDESQIQWGNLANQLGRVVEDLIIPNIGPLIKKYFDGEIYEHYADIYKRKSSTNEGKQFDGIITTDRYVFLFEVKNQITQEHVNTMDVFVKSGDIFDYFTAFEGKKLVPVMGSINLKEHQVVMLTRAGILALSIKGDILEFSNYLKLKDKL